MFDKEIKNKISNKSTSVPDRATFPRITKKKPEINVNDIQKFVSTFHPGPYSFQTFDDDKSRDDKKLVSKDWYGTLNEYIGKLTARNLRGANASLCINVNAGAKRAKDKIVKTTALWVDTDGAPLQPILDMGVTPHMIVESSPGKYHVYWLTEDCAVDQWEAVMRALAEKFNCDEKVCRLQTVMRIPGFLHQKNEPFLSRIKEFNPDLPKYKTDEFITAMALVIKDPKKTAEPRTKPNTQEILLCLYNNADGDSDLFTLLNNDRFVYDWSCSKWFKWNKNFWEQDVLCESLETVRDLCDIYATEAENQGRLRATATNNARPEAAKTHEKNEENLLKRVTLLQSLRRKKEILELSVIGQNKLGITGQEWDIIPKLLPVKNGLVDMETGNFRPGHQSDFVKTVIPHEWKGKDEPCPEFEKFMKSIIVNSDFMPDPETYDYLHRVLGYTLAGNPILHLFIVLWGPHGQNGKGTLFDTLKFVLGPLAGKIPVETLLYSRSKSDGSAARPDLMKFRGLRLNWASEPNKGSRFNVGIIKDFTGGEPLTARHLYGGLIEFDVTHTTFLLTNEKPRIFANKQDSIWDRLVTIPFHLKHVENPVEDYERKKDPELREKLKKEAPGILAWLVRGYMEYRKHGLKKSAQITDAGQDYKNDEDVLGLFIEETIDVTKDKSDEVRGGELFQAYLRWCQDQSVTSTNKNSFGQDMKTRFAWESKRGTIYKGLKIRQIESQKNEPKQGDLGCTTSKP